MGASHPERPEGLLVSRLVNSISKINWTIEGEGYLEKSRPFRVCVHCESTIHSLLSEACARGAVR